MAPILDLTNANHWEHFYNVILNAQQLDTIPPIYYPIPSHTIPGTVDRRTLAIGASSTQTQPTWVLAFFLISSATLAGIGKANVSSNAVFLGLNLVRLPNVSDEFYLRLKIPRWHREMDLTIWKYIGPESDD